MRVFKNFKFRVIGFFRDGLDAVLPACFFRFWFVISIGFLKEKLTDIGFYGLAFSGFWIKNFSLDLDRD